MHRFGGRHRGYYALAQVGSRRAQPGSESDPGSIQRRILGIRGHSSGTEQEKRFDELRTAYEVKLPSAIVSIQMK